MQSPLEAAGGGYTLATLFGRFDWCQPISTGIIDHIKKCT
jgi:hypothetical protein